MFLITVSLNLFYADGEQVQFGPYLFDKWGTQDRWKMLFTGRVRRLNAKLFPGEAGPFRIEPTFSSDGLEEEAVEPPAPQDMVANVRRVWEEQQVAILST